jgi:tetratricopeptide (TPR) repeat protein
MLQNAITPQISEGGENLFGDFFKNFAFWRDGGEGRYSANLRASWLGSFLEDRLEGGIDMDIKDIFSQTEEFTRTIYADTGGSAATRLEDGSKRIEFDMNFRVGGWPLRRIVAGWFQWGTDYWGLSAGFNMPMVNGGRDLMVMYQYINLFEEEHTRNHTWYFTGEFGNHREEIYARRMARLADVFPNSLYEKGMRLYHQGKYWDAYFVFGRLVAQYPDFFKNDWVSYYRGASLEAMDMRDQAIRTFRGTIGDYPRSKAVKHAELGIMRVAYLQNDDNIVARQYETLDTDETPDSLRNHAHYLMGENFMKNENYRAARNTFERIPPGHPDYIFAQHSLAIAYVHVPSLEQAALALQRCLQEPTETKAQEEISNRSALLLGLLYYEQQALSQAVSALRLVPQGTYHYGEALLGLGWTALKARQWNDCISAGRELAARADYEELRADGLLLQGYAYLVQKDHLNAARVLGQALEIAEQLDTPSVDSLVSRRREYSRDREQYRLLAGRAKELSLMNPNSQIAKTTDSLHQVQEQLVSKIGKHKDFIDNIEREMFFSRNITTIRADIEYAQAVVQKIVNRSQEMRATEDAREEQEDIDEKIRDLRRDLEKLESEDSE